ncbi:DUF3224 domain-containing protein [Agaribacter flavus]|uniref:DUF3224 domain-containing protein n=1 Tax=Agaribacter flavus TaxID=1902781 RepID=A0ABV7FQ80_9ALTE
MTKRFEAVCAPFMLDRANLPILHKISGGTVTIVSNKISPPKFKDITMVISGEFSITQWQEECDTEFSDGGKISTAKVTQQYTGTIIGESSITYKMHYDASGDAQFVGLEHIEAAALKIEGEEFLCDLVFKHDGQFTKGVAQSQLTILRCSAYKKLEGKTGEFTAQAGGRAVYSIKF